MTKARPYSKGTHQYLTFVGPAGYRLYPIIRSCSSTFKGQTFPKLVSINGRQEAERRKAIVR